MYNDRTVDGTSIEAVSYAGVARESLLVTVFGLYNNNP